MWACIGCEQVIVSGHLLTVRISICSDFIMKMAYDICLWDFCGGLIGDLAVFVAYLGWDCEQCYLICRMFCYEVRVWGMLPLLVRDQVGIGSIGYFGWRFILEHILMLLLLWMCKYYNKFCVIFDIQRIMSVHMELVCVWKST